jgi:hypothetical protein
MRQQYGGQPASDRETRGVAQARKGDGPWPKNGRQNGRKYLT